MCCNLSPEPGAHVSGLWLSADPTEVKTVGIPARGNRWLVAQPTLCVCCASVMEKPEMFVTDVEQHASKTRGVGRS